MITPPHSPPEMCENANPNSYFPSLPFPTLFLRTCRAQTPEPMFTFDGSNTWFGMRKCLLYNRKSSNEFRGHYPLKTNYQNSSQDVEIPAKFEISNFRCNLIFTHWTDFHEIGNYVRVHKWELDKDSDMAIRHNSRWRRPPSWKKKKCYNF